MGGGLGMVAVQILRLGSRRGSLNPSPEVKQLAGNKLKAELTEGWALVLTDAAVWKIVSINGDRFRDDAEAVEYVKERARNGSEIHAYALLIHNND